MPRKHSSAKRSQTVSHSSSDFDVDITLLRRFFDDAGLGICVVNTHNQLVFWNRALQNMLGYTKRELLRLTPEDLTHPDDYARERECYINQVRNQKRNTYRIEKRIKHKDGIYFWASVTASLIRGKGGKIKYGIGIIEDINERKETEARLLESEERFRFVSEMISDYAYSYRVHQDGTIEREWITDAVARITGYSAQELLHSNTWTTAVHPDDMTLSKQKLAEVLSGNFVDYAIRIFTKDGQLRWIHDYAFPIWDSEKQHVVKIYGAVTDITAQKNAQEVLAKSEARFRQLFEFAPIGVAVVEYGGKLLDVNPAICKFLGYSREELLMKHLADLSPIEDVKANLHIHDLLLEGKMEYAILNKRYITKEGRQVIGELHVRLLDKPKNALPRFIGQVIDITNYQKAKAELEARERRFRLLIQDSSDITAIADIEGNLTYISPSVKTILGYSPEVLIGKSVFNRLHPDDLERARAGFQAILHEVQTMRFECRYQHRNGEWKFIEAHLTRQLDEPTIQGIVFNVRDITERKQIEQQLLQAQKMEAIGTLAGGIAHDFNNIMASILIATQLVKQKPDHERTQERMEMIERAVKRGKGVVEQMLYFARNKASETKRVDCTAIVTQVIEMLEHSFPKEIQIVNRMRERAMIFGDADQLYQVFLNIAINARDAMPHGGTLTFECETFHDETSPWVAIHITDTGTGIPDDVLGRIFEPFFTTKEVGKGTGLGLAVVHSVVKSHRGRIEVSTKVGAGTRFSLYFPSV